MEYATGAEVLTADLSAHTCCICSKNLPHDAIVNPDVNDRFYSLNKDEDTRRTDYTVSSLGERCTIALDGCGHKFHAGCAGHVFEARRRELCDELETCSPCGQGWWCKPIHCPQCGWGEVSWRFLYLCRSFGGYWSAR